MIKIIDYGLGNIQAITNVYKSLFIPCGVARTAEEVFECSHLILPGVGSFDHAIKKFQSSGMAEPVTDLVKNKKIPLLGICVGMQLLSYGSDEGELPGLGWVPGRVRSFKSVDARETLRLPHMGWNDVFPEDDCSLFKGIEKEMRFYFLHSYFFECENKNHSRATSDYGRPFSCVVSKENIYGVQFHPEKSHHFGTTLLKNFAEIAC